MPFLAVEKMLLPAINQKGKGPQTKEPIQMEQFWNERYAQPDWVYGQQPNVFFKEQLAGRPPGKLLLAAEGEGRNAVYAARQGWQVVAFDFSAAGQQKALQLAAQAGVGIDYQLQKAEDFRLGPHSLDAAGLIYAHFPPDIRKRFHARLQDWLKPGGVLILEAFHPRQLQYQSGGPKQENMLYSADMLQQDFEGLKILLLEEREIVLDEGSFHQGAGYVTRLVASKPEA